MRLDEFLESDNVESAPAGDFDSLVASIRHVESGGNSRAVSPQGASGSMQIMPATFRQYAIDGESYDNDSHRTNAAIRKLEDDYAYYDGDLSKTAAAYIGGRGAVRKDGSIRDDVKDAHGTSPMAYANRVLGRMGQGGRSDYSSKQEDDAPADEFAEFDKFLSGRTLGAVESAMQQEPSTASKNSDGAFSRGVSGTKSSAAQTYALATGDFEGAAKTLAEQQAYRQRNPESPEEKKFMDDYRGANGVIESLGAVVKNPVGFAKANIAQIPNMVAPMAGMIGLGAAGSTAGPVGTVAGGFTGATLGNALVEGGQKIEQALNEAGINPNDTASVTAFLRENQGDILTKTGIKAGVIGAVDTATMGIASAWLKAPARAAMQANERLLTGMGVNVADKVAVQSAMRSPVYIAGREAIDGAYKAATSGATNFARHAGVAAMGPGGEFSGEYFGEGFSTGDYNASEAGLEALMASGTSAATFAGQKAYAVATNPFKTDGTQPAAPPAPTPATILAQPDVDSAIAAASAVTAAPVNQDALLAELDSGLNLATLEPELLETVNDAAPFDAPSNLGTGIDGSGSAGNPSVVPSIETGRGGDATAPLPDSGTVAPVGDAGTALGDVTQHTIVAPDIRSAIQAAHNQFGESATIVSQQITEGGVSLTVSVPAATAGDVSPLRPQTIAGKPAASYTDAELQTTATSPLIHMDTRKSAMLELQARSMGQMDQDILALEAQNVPLNEPEPTNEASQAPLQQSPVAAVQPGRLVGTDANRVPVVLDNREAVSALGLGYTRLDALPERVGDSPEVTSARRQEVAQLEQLVGLTGAKLHLVSHESGTPQFGGAYIPELPGHIFVDVNNNGAVKQALRVVIAHESMHDLEARNPKLYQSLVAAVQQHTTKISKQEFEALYGQTLPSDSRVTSEQMANLLGNVLYKPENVERLLMDAYGPDVDGAAGFIATIRKVLRSLMDKLGGNFDARSYKGNFDEVEKILMEGYGAFIKASGKAGVSAKLSLQQAENRLQQSPVAQSAVTKLGFQVRGDAIWGAPPNVKTVLHIRKQINQAVKDALSDRAHPEDAVWYRQAGKAIREYAHGDQLLQEKLVRLVAKLSQASGVDSNVTSVIKAAYQIAHGEPVAVGRFPNVFRESFSPLMDAPVFDASLSGVDRKLQNFYRNLHDESFQKNEWPDAVVIDRHAIAYLWNDKAKTTVDTDAQYTYAETVMQQATVVYNKQQGTALKPRDMQALLWGWWKRRDAAMAAKAEGKEYKATGTAWNYPEFFERATANITAEVLPSTQVSHLDLKMDAKQKATFQKEALNLIFDDEGNNELAKRAGLVLYTQNESSGGYEAKTNPNLVTGAIAAKIPKQSGDGFTYHRYTYDAVDRYALAWQYIFKQDGVPWFRADRTIDPAELDRVRQSRIDRAAKGQKVAANGEPPVMSQGYYLVFDKDLTADEESQVFAALRADVSQTVGYTKIKPNSLAVINYRGDDGAPFMMSDADFKSALAEFADNTGVASLEPFAAESRYHYYDFHEESSGERLLENEAIQSGQRDFPSWLSGRREAFDALVTQWEGRVQRSPVEQRRSDVTGDERAGGSDAGESGQTLPGYGRASPGAVTVQGTHYSQAERSNLDGRYYGTGARGDEAERVRAATDPRLKERVYFYVNKGNGVTPEQGVGSIAHTAQLNNVYDQDADTWVQKKLARGLSGDSLYNAFESAVLDNGFDGYVSDFGTQRAAVLLGRHNVPVKAGKTDQVSKAKERPTDPLAARRDLPMGKMSGADWKRMLPEMDLAHLEDGKSYYKDGLAAVQYSPVRQAPNGKPSNLDEKQYAQVRTPEFKAWFGDWEHAAANGGVWSTDKVSKVVDENGEPLVVYHGAENGGFTKLDPAKGDKHRSPMIFAARTANTARSYSGRGDEIDLNTGMYDRSDDDYDEQRGIYSLFLNIRNPNEDHMEGANWDGSRFDDQWRVLDENGDTYYTTDGKGYFTRDDADTIVEGNPGYELQQEPEMYRTTNSIAEEALKYGNDGAIIRQVVDDGGRGGIVDADDIFVIFDSNQAKSATQNTGAFSAKNDDLRYSPLAQVWADVAKDEDAFQFPTSEQTDFVALMAEIDPALRVSEKGVFDDKTAKRFVVTMPDNKSADVFVGKNKEMWVNASQLKVGKSSGVALYAGMLNYAHNNGYVLKGDPLGVSTMATFRRTENMISSALKFGTTRHMRPSDTQRSPQSFKDRIGYSDGVINQFAPMAWEEGNDLANIDSMLRVSYANIQSLLPEIENARYNFTNGTFEWAGTDRPIAESEWTDLSERLHGALLAGRAASSELGGRRVATASPGEAPRSATVKRAAVTATVLREPGGALGGVLLGREGGELPVGLAAGRPFAGRERALKGVLYSPANAVSDQSPTDRTLDADRLTELRRAAARLERPRDAVFLRVTDTGHVIATGPKGTRVPETFTRFARDQGLSFEARRNGGNNGLASNSAPMPEAYRESGARYFGEGNISFDRTGKTRFSPVTQTSGRFYSQLSRAFEQAPDKVFGKAPQVALWLKSNAGKLGVKQDEIQWTGISDWLALQDKVSKADVLGYLAQNGVQVEEVEKGAKPGEPTVSFEDGKWVVRGGSGKVFGRYSSEEDANTARPRAFEYSLVPTKYSQYVLPGGENYRELLLTLPEKHTYPKTPVLTRAQQNAMALLNNKMRKDGNLPASEMAEWRAYRDQERAYAAELEQLKAAGKNKEPFRSSHWEEDNILAHVRFNDRTDAEGSKVLFIEELQSDWGQGFKKFKDKNTDDLEIALRQVDKQPIPAAPFVTDTKSWLSLGIKRMIAYAAENGYDKVAFVNGEQSADRYDLSKTIRRLEYKPDSKELTAFDHNGRAVLDERVEPENIEDYIGKDPAKRLLESEPVTTGAGKKVHSIEGDGLKIGGEGMKTFYDKIVPQTINDVLKKLGGGKVERVSLPLGKETWNGADTGRVTIGNEFVSQNGFTITPELRASVQGGMPLFAPVNQATTPAWATEVTGKVDSFIYEIQDKFIDLKRVRDAIKEAGIQVREEYDAYVAEELNHGRAAYRVQLFLEQEFDPLLAEMKMRGVTAEEFDKYLHARHAPERNAAMAKANPNQAELDQSILDAEDDVHTAELDLQMANGAQAELWALQKAQSKLAALQVTKPFSGTEEQRQMLSGMSNAEAALVIAAGRPTMAALGQKVDDIVASTRTLLSGYGLETQETVAAMAKAYKHYVPLMREMDESDLLGTGGNGTGAGYSIKGSTLKRATGSLRKVESILANLMAQREQAIVRGEKALVGKSLYGMALSAPNPEFWSVIRPNMSAKAMKAAMLDANMDPALIKAMVDAPLEAYIDPSTGMVRFRANPMIGREPNAIVVRVAGQDRVILFNAQNDRAVRLADALKNADSVHFKGWLKSADGGLGQTTRYISAVNTQYNPIFGIKNFVRDFQGAGFNLSTTQIKGQEAKVLGHVGSAIRAIYRQERGKSVTRQAWADAWQEFRESGAETGYMDAFNGIEDRVSSIQKHIKGHNLLVGGVMPILNWLGDYNTAIENGVRLSAYKAARESGMSKIAAASMAKNLTVNFNRKGRTGGKLSGWFAFFNAAVQGNARIIETFRGGRKGKAAAMFASKLAISGMTIGATLALIGIALMGDDWDDIPEFVRERDIIIPLGKVALEGANIGKTKEGWSYLHIPMALGFHLLPATGRTMVELAMLKGDEGKRMTDLLSAWVGGMNPMGSINIGDKGWGAVGEMVAPSVVDPFLQLGNNQNAFGRPIAKQNRSELDPTPAPDRFFKSASSFGKAASKGLDRVSGGDGAEPGYVQFTPDQIDFIFGQITGGVGRESLKAYQYLESKVTGDSIPESRVPIKGMFYGETKSEQSVTGKFYELERKVHIAERGIKLHPTDEGKEKYTKSHPEVQLSSSMKASLRDLTRLQKYRKRADADGDKAEVKRLDGESTAARLRVLDAYDELER